MVQRTRRMAVCEDRGGGDAEDFLSEDAVGSSSQSRCLPISSPPAGAVGLDLNGGTNCICHAVSRFDTLAGVAIRYGVEVTDIKRLNGLSTDLQMFALKTLKIPLPGRHPPSSPVAANGHVTPPRTTSSGEQGRRQSDFFDSFQSLKSASSSEKRVSLAMSTLRGYYGLEKRSPGEGFEMTALYRHHDGASSPHMNPPLSLHRKSRSVANSLMSANGAPEDAPPRPSSLEEGSGNNSGAGNSSSSPSSSSSEKWFEKLLRRRQKSESDFASYPPEKILREEETSCGSTMSTAITGKGLALRPKSSSSSSRTDVDHHHHHHHPSPFPMNLSGGGGGDSSPQAVADGVRKSSSTSCLQDAENGTFSSLWSTSKWSLKPDFQALSSAAIPIFDGLPKAIGKKNKTAVD